MLGVVVVIADATDVTAVVKGLCMTFPKFPGFWSCDILTVFRKSFGCLNDSMLNTKHEWGLHLPSSRSVYKQGLEKEVTSGKSIKIHNLGAYMSGAKM